MKSHYAPFRLGDISAPPAPAISELHELCEVIQLICSHNVGYVTGQIQGRTFLLFS